EHAAAVDLERVAVAAVAVEDRFRSDAVDHDVGLVEDERADERAGRELDAVAAARVVERVGELARSGDPDRAVAARDRYRAGRRGDGLGLVGAVGVDRVELDLDGTDQTE